MGGIARVETKLIRAHLWKKGKAQTKLCSLHRGAFCQFIFWWIYYCYNSKCTGKETGKTHFCALHCTAFPIIRTVLIFLGTFQIYVPLQSKKIGL